MQRSSIGLGRGPAMRNCSDTSLGATQTKAGDPIYLLEKLSRVPVLEIRPESWDILRGFQTSGSPPGFEQSICKYLLMASGGGESLPSGSGFVNHVQIRALT